MIVDTHDGVGVRSGHEVGVVVMPLEGLDTMEGFTEEEGEMALSIEFESFWDRRVGDLTDSGEPVDGSGWGGDGRIGTYFRGPVNDGGGVDGAVPEAVFVTTVGGCGAVIPVFFSSSK